MYPPLGDGFGVSVAAPLCLSAVRCCARLRVYVCVGGDLAVWSATTRASGCVRFLFFESLYSTT